jgi:hypothetical protein
MSSTPAITVPPRRHALGLPAGSVRALLAFGVLGLLWAILLRYRYQDVPLTDHKLPWSFIYLQYLMVLILAHFFAAHGNSIGPRVSTRAPLGLPGGSVRFLLIVGYLGLAIVLYQTNPQFEYPSNGPYILLLMLLISGFFLGHVLSGVMRMLGGGQPPDWYMDFEAWLSLIALLGFGALVIVHLFINPNVKDELRVDLPTTEAILAGIVGYYFGARS